MAAVATPGERLQALLKTIESLHELAQNALNLNICHDKTQSDSHSNANNEKNTSPVDTIQADSTAKTDNASHDTLQDNLERQLAAAKALHDCSLVLAKITNAYPSLDLDAIIIEHNRMAAYLQKFSKYTNPDKEERTEQLVRINLPAANRHIKQALWDK